MTITRLLPLTLCALLCALVQSGCISREPRPAPVPAPAQGQYLVQPGDLLMVMFTDEPNLNQQVRVEWNGRISLPYLTKGEPVTIMAGGQSVAALARRITDIAQKNDVLINPRVQVLVADYASQTFVVLGQVAVPGRYAFPRGLPPRLDLEEAVALAGGYTRLARQSLVIVKRGETVEKIDLHKLSTEAGHRRFVVQPGDIITVTERIF